MAKQKPSRRLWWQLDLLVLIMTGLLFLTHSLAPSPGWRTFLEIVGVIVGFGLIALWLEAHPTVLQHQPSAEIDSSTLKALELELPSSLSSSLPHRLYIASDPAIIYGEPEDLTSNRRSNGYHHLARTTPSLPEETAE